MDEQKIKIFLCQQIIQLAFTVEPEKRVIWIRQCISTFHSFWQTTSIAAKITKPKPDLQIDIDADELDLLASMTINKTKVDDFSVTFKNLANSEKEEFLLRHESHSTYQSQINLDYPFSNEEKTAARLNFTQEQLEEAIDYLILHPFTHIHIKMNTSPDNHIRLGGGISNSLLYLFHLRYQLCPIPIREPKGRISKKPEKDRLYNLFADAIRNNKMIDKTTLFEVPN